MHVDNSPPEQTKYDMIIGRDLLKVLGIDLLFSSQEIRWEGATAPMRDPEMLHPDKLEQLEMEVYAQESVEEDFIQRMTDQKYSPANLKEEVEKSTHLTHQQRKKLFTLLQKYQTLFDGTLGTWKTKPIELELKEGASPYYGRPYPVPKSQEKKLKQEVARMVKYGVLRKINHSEWGIPAFTIVIKMESPCNL